LTTADQSAPFFIRNRRDASNLYEDVIDITDTENWLQAQSARGFGSLNLLHVLIAAYVRTAAVMPAINRFVSGQRVYARNEITVIIEAARNESDSRAARFVKVALEPTDTVYDVYRKIGSAVQQIKAAGNQQGQLPVPEGVLRLPRPFVKFAFWMLRTMDYFGRLPNQYMNNSPYHGSLSISSLAVHGARPTYLSLGDFGNLPMTMSISTGQMQSRRAMNLRVVYDSRIADVYYFTEAFGYMKELIRSPALLETAPESVFEDIF